MAVLASSAWVGLAGLGMKARPAGLRAVLFDWDGTLVDSAEASYRCYERLFGEYGITFDRGQFERTYSPNWHRTYEVLGLPHAIWEEADARWLVHYAEERPSCCPGRARRWSAFGRGPRAGGRDQRRRGRVAPRSNGSAWSAFRQLTGAEDTVKRKPRSRAAAPRAGARRGPPGDAAYVGDSPEDVEMARAAGVWVLGCPAGSPTVPPWPPRPPTRWPATWPLRRTRCSG